MALASFSIKNYDLYATAIVKVTLCGNRQLSKWSCRIKSECCYDCSDPYIGDCRKRSCWADVRLYQKRYCNPSKGNGSDAVLSPFPELAESIPLAGVLVIHETFDLFIDRFSGQSVILGTFSLVLPALLSSKLPLSLIVRPKFALYLLPFLRSR